MGRGEKPVRHSVRRTLSERLNETGPSTKFWIVPEVRQPRRRRYLDEDRHQQHRLQRPGCLRPHENSFVAPVDGTYLLGPTLIYKVNASTTARMRDRLVLNGTTEIRGSFGEISAPHVSLATSVWLQTIVPLIAGDTVELQGYFRVADCYFAADQTSFWGAKIGRKSDAIAPLRPEHRMFSSACRSTSSRRDPELVQLIGAWCHTRER